VDGGGTGLGGGGKVLVGGGQGADGGGPHLVIFVEAMQMSFICYSLSFNGKLVRNGMIIQNCGKALITKFQKRKEKWGKINLL
jgi:hypothetical protein